MNDVTFSFGGASLPGGELSFPSTTYVLIAHDSSLAVAIHGFMTLMLLVLFGMWVLNVLRRSEK